MSGVMTASITDFGRVMQISALKTALWFDDDDGA
jgi:hypothetical protein